MLHHHDFTRPNGASDIGSHPALEPENPGRAPRGLLTGIALGAALWGAIAAILLLR